MPDGALTLVILTTQLGVMVGVLVGGAYGVRVLIRAVRSVNTFASASASNDVSTRELLNHLVRLEGEHVELTGYIHKSVHDLRDNLQTVRTDSIRNHAATVQAVEALVAEVRRLPGMPPVPAPAAPPRAARSREGN